MNMMNNQMNQMNMSMNNMNNNNQFLNMNQNQGMNNNSNSNFMNMQMVNNKYLNFSQNLLNENKDITNKDIANIQEANIIIKELRKENRNLKDRLDRLEEEFKQYKKEMKLSCCYNMFDVNAYKLDNIYNLFSKNNIIQKKEEFALINKAISHLFNKSMRSFDCVYKCKGNEFEPLDFKQIFDCITYSVIIISTTNRDNNRRFGLFRNKNFELNNLNNINNNQAMMYRMSLMLNNKEEEIKIFDSDSCSYNSFVFSLDDLYIYYNVDINKLHSFSILYNKKFEILYGKEKSVSPMFYKLSGKNEFNIECLELYEVKI
jgi:hypothetical protein